MSRQNRQISTTINSLRKEPGTPSDVANSWSEALIADLDRKLHVPQDWEAAAAEIFERRLRKVLVIGGSAAGKSSFCRYLAEALLARPADVAVVDADRAVLVHPRR
ncbi:hypothetical protein KMZ93_19725 [Bradyrhizobium sediminis]|uniref:Uncharacterized protein n=1 Tax=Bradyrhizobium sediminis TaxID=2840469 RepID=A0A975NWY8_9BRAD|nr:hypothetical protein [Bradyrhizobium sediminis]QWG22191.1 hypothetical protein KMZ93_19725 [Bradyrhizobium sediminis]